MFPSAAAAVPAAAVVIISVENAGLLTPGLSSAHHLLGHPRQIASLILNFHIFETGLEIAAAVRKGVYRSSGGVEGDAARKSFCLLSWALPPCVKQHGVLRNSRQTRDPLFSLPYNHLPTTAQT